MKAIHRSCVGTSQGQGSAQAYQIPTLAPKITRSARRIAARTLHQVFQNQFKCGRVVANVMGAGPVAEVAARPVGSQEDDEGSSCDEPELTLLPAESGSPAVAQWLDPGVGPYNGAYAGLCSALGAPCECQAVVFLVMASSEVVGALAVDLFSRRRTRAACRICFDTAAAEMLVGVCACRGKRCSCARGVSGTVGEAQPSTVFPMSYLQACLHWPCTSRARGRSEGHRCSCS